MHDTATSRCESESERQSKVSRRKFLALSAASAAVAGAAGCATSSAGEGGGGSGDGDDGGSSEPFDIFTPPPIVERRDDMPYRVFGRTGEHVSMLGVGGYHIGNQTTSAESIEIIRTAIDSGINFMDNAWEYNGGVSEKRMGLALTDGYREKVFLMTKVCGRDRKTAMANLEESLKRLRTDVIDLWQFHECNYDNDPDWIFSDDGAVHAAVEAKKQGKIRFIGFTGHKSPHIHQKMLAQDFDWDSLQCPINILDSQYRSFARTLLPIAAKRKMGVVAMKPLGGDGGIPRNAGVTVEECLRYSLSLHVPLTLSGMQTVDELKANMAIVKRFKPLSVDEREELFARVRRVAGDGRYERFKSTQVFDSSVHREQHGLG